MGGRPGLNGSAGLYRMFVDYLEKTTDAMAEFYPGSIAASGLPRFVTRHNAGSTAR